jgi:hypothetical protein
MRKLLTLLVVALACAHPTTAQDRTGRESAGLNGPARAVRVETARVSNASGQSVEGARALAQILSFDERGNTTGQTVFNPDGSTRWKLAWGHTYDAKGRETEISYRNAGGALTSRAVSVYDAQGRKAETTFYTAGGAVNHVETFEYDDGGKLIREFRRSPDGTIRSSSVYAYDDAGRLAELSLHKWDGTRYQRTVYTYDEKGRETEWVIYLPDESTAMGRKYVYDERGSVTESLRYGNGVLLSRETFTYEFDARGNWVKRRVVRETLKEGASHTETDVNYRTITYY